jgi:hypothetical protein
MTTATDARESERFTTLYQAVERDMPVGVEQFADALNRMTVSGVIEALSNEERMVTTPADRGTKSLKVDDVTFQAYAYLSPSGLLQIWMEAFRIEDPKPAILARARFSWNPVDQSPEDAAVHERHSQRVFKLRIPHGRKKPERAAR